MAGVAGNPLPLEGESPEVRRDKIERLRRAVSALPRTPGVGLFLANVTGLDCFRKLRACHFELVGDDVCILFPAAKNDQLHQGNLSTPFFISFSLCISEMVGVAGNPLPLEGESPEVRRDKIERRKESSEGNRLRLLHRQEWLQGRYRLFLSSFKPATCPCSTGKQSVPVSHVSRRL